MNSASPTTSASTNRGGRPKDWTDPRARRLVRLYIYTRLPFDLILKLLEDGVWKPGKDAANKVKNSLLGNDPRWIRPKDDEDERRRIAALRNSRRGARLQHRTSSPHSARSHCNTCIPGCYDTDTLTPTRSTRHSFENSNVSPSPHHGGVNLTSQVGANISNYGHDELGAQIYSHPSWISSGVGGLRKDTGLTNSTETSMSSSFCEKLSTVSRDQAKGAWRVLKQFTFPKDTDLREMSFSPVVSPGSHLQPAQRGFPTPGEPTVDIPSSARYAVPGDFLDVGLYTRRSLCDNGSVFHETGTCWCRIVNDLNSIQAVWPIEDDIFATHINNSDDIYGRMDAFGNTAFHRLAATAVGENPVPFLDLISQALAIPHSLVRANNTAGQTFLHVLHQSWYDEGSPLTQLINILGNYPDFNILATDVYGRSFFHLLQNRRPDSARIPPHLDWNLLKRRDAFGIKPMESRPRHSMIARSPGNADILPTIIDISSDRGDESRIRPQAKLIEIVVNAVKVDNINSTNPDPRSEDSLGRNALHCLAEVILDMKSVQDSADENQRQKKRKHRDDDGESRPESSSEQKRLEYLEGIITAGVDVNHYDCQGQTPLMAFVKHRPEDSRLEKETMERIIKMLHTAGANLEARNRGGETALHVAARYGKKVAVKELLQLGANPYVRDACGLSVLAAIDDRWVNAEDGLHIARLEACRGVFTSVVQTAAQEPTVLQEWGLNQQSVGSS